MAAAREAAVDARRRPRARGLSRARAQGQRPRPRLPRQRRLVAAAVGGHRRGRGLRARRTTPTCTAACTRCRRKRRRCTKARARSARRFVNAASTAEIVFVRGTTEAINLVAQSYARPRLGAGDEIVVTRLEHHSNIVPWQLARRADRRAWSASCRSTGAASSTSRPICGLLGPRTRIVALAHVSNALGTVLPLAEFIAAARERGIVTVVDGAQAVPHLRGRRAGARLRLLRLLRAQDVRPDRHRRAVRARGRCSPRCRPGRAAAT